MRHLTRCGIHWPMLRFERGLRPRNPRLGGGSEGGRRPPPSVLAALGRIRAPAHGDQRLLIVEDIHVHERHRAPDPPHPRSASDDAADRRLEVVDAQVDRRDAAAHHHSDREVAHDVDEGGERPTVKLRGAGAPLELGADRHGYGQRAGGVIERDGVELEKGQERRAVEDGLDLLEAQTLRGGLAHGCTTTLPNTSRSSRRRKASLTSSSGSSRSTMGVRLPSRIIRMSVSRSSRIQPFDPSTFSSYVQMKRRSSLGSKPAVAPHVSTLPPRWRTRSDGTHVSPPVKLTTTSTPPVNFRRCGLPNVS